MTAHQYKATLDYLQKVVNVLDAHAEQMTTQAKLIDLRGQFAGKSFDTSDELISMAETLRQHSQYIKDVIDSPHLLTVQ